MRQRQREKGRRREIGRETEIERETQRREIDRERVRDRDGDIARGEERRKMGIQVDREYVRAGE